MVKNSDNVQQILADLYAIDPGLKRYEPTLVKLITELMAARPDTKFDATVAAQLRRQLMARADLLGGNRQTSTFTNLNFMKRLNYVLGGVAVVAVAVAVFGWYGKNPASPIIPQSNDGDVLSAFATKQEIVAVSSNAFGKLAMNEAAPAGRGGGSAAAGFGGSPNIDQRTEASAVAPAPDMAAKIMPPLTNYKYVYKGEDFELGDAQVDVYRRVKGLSGAAANKLLKNLNFGLVDMGKFSNTSVESLNITEDREYGYNLSFSFREGTISIYENWLKWPNPGKDCRDEACYQSIRLQMSDVPSDERVLALADQFLRDHNISTESYGQPSVQNTWRAEYERFEDKSQFYIPDVLTVIYPLKINGEEVYDESGNKTGLSVNVNIRAMKVSGVMELSSQRYESSKYDAISDKNRVLEIAEKGGFREIYYAMEGGRTVEVELGTPVRSMVKVWMPRDNGQSDELLVPALVFPVTKRPAGEVYFRQSVVVPLVKDVVDNREYPMPIDIMRSAR